MPPYIRAFTTSERAAVKLWNLRVTPGIALETTLKELSSPKVWDRMWVAAPLAQECADGYSGNGGDTINDVHAESAAVASLPSVAANWIAVIGRHEAIGVFRVPTTDDRVSNSHIDAEPTFGQSGPWRSAALPQAR